MSLGRLIVTNSREVFARGGDDNAVAMSQVSVDGAFVGNRLYGELMRLYNRSWYHDASEALGQVSNLLAVTPAGTH